MQNEILDLIDQIEMEQAIAEMAVCDALMNSYAKTCAILENASDNADLSSYDIFQEGYEVYQEGEKWDRVKQAGSTAWKEAKGKKSENIVIRILKFIPRLIMAFVRSLRMNKKEIDKKIDEVEKVAEKITEAVEKGDISEEDISGGSADDSARRAAAAVKNQPLALPYYPVNNLAFYYANGDIRLKFAWGTFNVLEKMNNKTLDYAELMIPIESALEMIVDTFSETRLNKNGKPDTWQRRNKSDLVFDVHTHDLPGKIVLIKNKIKEAEKWISELNKNFNKNWKIDVRKGDVRECMLSEVLQAFSYASRWIGQNERILEVSAKRIKSVVDNLPTFKSGIARDPLGDDYATDLKPDDANTVVTCVNRVQTIVDQANKCFAYIVKNCSDALDKVYAMAHFAAGKAGITIKSHDELEMRNMAHNITVPYKQGDMFDNIDIHGYRKGVRDFNDLIRAPRD